MENLLPPLVILLCVVVIVALVLRRGARRSKESAGTALAGGSEAAAKASARLTEDQHRAIYSFIAQGMTVQAIAAYRQATGAGLIEARNAVLLMDRYPQPYGLPSTGAPEAEAGAENDDDRAGHAEQTEAAASDAGQETAAEPTPPTPSATPVGEEAPPSPVHHPTAPTTLGERSTMRYPYRYRAIVSNGRQTLEVASNLLNDEIYGEIKALAQIGDAEDAARLLWRHSDISIEEARAFVELL